MLVNGVNLLVCLINHLQSNMKNIKNFIEEAYKPALNRDQGKVVDVIYKAIAKAIKSNVMTKEDAIEMLNDLIATVEADF